MSENNSQIPPELLAVLQTIRRLETRQPSHNQLKREAVKYIFDSANLVTKIAEVFANYRLVSQRELDYSRKRGLTAEQFEAETRKIENLMRKRLTARLMRETTKLYVALRHKVVKGKPLNITNWRKFDEDSLNFDKERGLVAKDEKPRNTGKELETEGEQKLFVETVDMMLDFVTRFRKMLTQFRSNQEKAFLDCVKGTNDYKTFFEKCKTLSKEKLAEEVLTDFLRDIWRKKNKATDELQPKHIAVKHTKNLLCLENKLGTLKKNYPDLKKQMRRT